MAAALYNFKFGLIQDGYQPGLIQKKWRSACNSVRFFSLPISRISEIEEVVEALRSQWITTGPRTKHLEQELTEFTQGQKTACLNSATAALECCLRALGIGEGDEVITSAYTYTASCSPICHVGATPVLCDIAPGSWEMDYVRKSAI